MGHRPVIGIVGYHHVVPRPFGDLLVSGAPTTYAESIAAAGGLPVLLPQGEAVDLLTRVDAVVLTGGGDVAPELYGGEPDTAVGVDPARDAAELAVIRAAVGARLPVLAICRGMQLLAVAHGGTLGDVVDHVEPETGHRVRTDPGSLVDRLIGPTPTTSALHRQAVVHPGPHLRVTAWTDDGVVEALEPRDPGWRVLGVQWHPELTGRPGVAETTGPALFGWLLGAARDPRLAASATSPGAWFCR